MQQKEQTQQSPGIKGRPFIFITPLPFFSGFQPFCPQIHELQGQFQGIAHLFFGTQGVAPPPLIFRASYGSVLNIKSIKVNRHPKFFVHLWNTSKQSNYEVIFEVTLSLIWRYIPLIFELNLEVLNMNGLKFFLTFCNILDLNNEKTLWLP